MKAPNIFVVTQSIGDRYHLWRVDLRHWFFTSKNAEAWIAKQDDPTDYAVEEVEGGDDEDQD